MFPLLRINSFTMVDNSFCSRVASVTSLLVAWGSRDRRIGRSYLKKTGVRIGEGGKVRGMVRGLEGGGVERIHG